jgi:hypothetical protein
MWSVWNNFLECVLAEQLCSYILIGGFNLEALFAPAGMAGFLGFAGMGAFTGIAEVEQALSGFGFVLMHYSHVLSN